MRKHKHKYSEFERIVRNVWTEVISPCAVVPDRRVLSLASPLVILAIEIKSILSEGEAERT